LSVADNGIGIKPEYHEQIFIPFKRLHGHSEYEGAGIGLSICRKAVERHGGSIWVESQAGQGTQVNFTLDDEPLDRGSLTEW
jgi:signal transduction histidine kinase